MPSKIRVGLVGVSPDRGFASIAHVPALQALPDFEIVAICTTRQESADAAAKHYGVPHAFADAAKLAAHPDVDLVSVTVKVPDHYEAVMAAIEAGKHVYCEWPLGRNTAEAERMAEAAAKRGVRHMVGLQGRGSPAINYVRDLIAGGHIGRVLSASMLINAANWGKTLDRAYQADARNGANLLTVTAAHNLDTLSYCLGEFRELSAFAVSQRTHVPLEGTGEIIPFNVPDQIALSGIAGNGTVVSFQARGGMWRGNTFLFEIHGEDGDLILSAPGRASSQRQELKLEGAQGTKAPLAEMEIPARYRWVPATTPIDSPYNVAQMYANLGKAIRGGTPVRPGFDDAVIRLRLLDAIRKASDSGERQAFATDSDIGSRTA